MKPGKLLLGIAAAVVMLGSFAGDAAAGKFSLSASTYRATYNTFELIGLGSVSCVATLEGTLHSRSFAKVVGSLRGFVEIAPFGRCERGSISVLSETRPWHLTYVGFTGTLPAISSYRVAIIGMGLRVTEAFGVSCLIRTEASEPAIMTFPENGTSLREANLEGTIGRPTCATRLRLRGNSAAFTSGGGAEGILLVLI